MCGDTIAMTGKRMQACRMVGFGGDFVPYSHTFNNQTTGATLNHKATNKPHSLCLQSTDCHYHSNLTETPIYEKKKNYTKNFNTDY